MSGVKQYASAHAAAAEKDLHLELSNNGDVRLRDKMPSQS